MLPRLMTCHLPHWRTGPLRTKKDGPTDFHIRIVIVPCTAEGARSNPPTVVAAVDLREAEHAHVTVDVSLSLAQEAASGMYWFN